MRWGFSAWLVLLVHAHVDVNVQLIIKTWTPVNRNVGQALLACRCNTPVYTPLETIPRKILGSTRIYPVVDSRIYPGVDPGGSQNLPLPPKIYAPFRDLLKCLRIPESTPSPKIYPLFNKCIFATFPKSTPPSQNIPPFSTTIWNPLRIYPPPL